ncbi:SwmB domain-containing protein [Alicyclobacillus macrosporangiidus]|uniref:Repeat-containing protein n=1 Tax=Alicyclobacillus macrosporangiidus TaxID=392015 RepID=A0A1I7HZ75_9BACL|nr:SwmB domain-containing protein [Alicyclobacillus macrosporangiidus]SFU66014.1 repeat-containing protein [Alicyclobacillus macrosporangiidus]
MKRALTGIAAASMVLGAFAPATFAATGANGWKYTVAHQLPIVVNGQVLSNPFELVANDSGNQTAYFPVYYFNQALNSIGYTATWDGSTHTWAITAPDVDASSISIPGGVGTGNTTITVNGTVVKKINTYAAKDPAGGASAGYTTYFPAYYINEVFSSLGAKVSFSGQTGLSITKQQPSSSAPGSIKAPSFTNQKIGDGSQASPAVSFGDPIKVSTTLQDANGNPVGGVNVLMDVVYYGSGAPTVKDVNGNTLAATTVSTSDGQAFQYKVPTDASGVATAQISVGANLSAGYMIRFEAPYNIQGTTSTLKSSKGYVLFVAPNKLGISPMATQGSPFEAAVSNGSNGSAGVVPVSVVIPPNSATAQAGVPVTFHLTNLNGGSAFFSTSSGGSIGTADQQVYTDSNGVATVYVDSASLGEAEVTASATNYSDVSTYIHWSQAGIVNKLDNKTASGYQTSPATDVYNANLGDNVTFQATAEDQNGNPVANAQLLIASSQISNGAPVNSAHGGYVDANGNQTAWPNVSVLNLKGSTNPSSLGEVVTTDASGNFSFTVYDTKLKNDAYYVYSIQGGVVQDLLWTTQVNWQAGTSLNYIGIAGAGGEIKYNSNDISGIVGQAQLGPYNPANLPIVRFAGFVGNGAPLSEGLNQTYTLSTSGEADGAINAVYVDHPNTSLPASDFNGNWYLTNPGNRGVGSITLRVAQHASGSNQYDVYVNGQLIGYNVQNGWNDTSNGADGEYPGTVKLAMADDDSGQVKLTVTSSNKTATATITFNGGAPVMAESFTPSQVILTSGQSQDLSFTLEDANGNPVANTLGAVEFQNAPNLWVTKINGVALSMYESGGSVGTGSAQEPTPIPLWDVSSTLTGNAALGYYNTGVNVAGVGNWKPSTNGYQTVYAYSDSNGKITLTLQDGAVSYWAGSGANAQVLSAPNDNNAQQTYYIYSPVDQSNFQSFAVYVAPSNTYGWDQEGVITWGSPSGSTQPSPVTEQGATVNASQLDITFSGNLLGTTADPAAFTVKDNGTPVTVSSASVSGTKVTLTLTSPVAKGDTVTVDYTPTGTNDLKDTNSQLIAAFSNVAVTNNTP